MTYAIRVCQIGCMAECSHGHACMVFMIDRNHPHPVDRGHEHHFAFDGVHTHEWNGAKGRCRIYLPEDEEAEGEITLVFESPSHPPDTKENHGKSSAAGSHRFPAPGVALRQWWRRRKYGCGCPSYNTRGEA